MKEVADWPSSTKCAYLVALRQFVLLVLLGITFVIAVTLSLEVPSLNEPCKVTRDSQIKDTAPWDDTEIESRLDEGIWVDTVANALAWRIKNQTRQISRAKWESEYTQWHPRIIDTSEFIEVEPIQPGRLELVRHPYFGERPILLKIADAHESMIYRLLYDLNVTPSFLGHVTQKGNVVGFITEFIEKYADPSAPSPSRRRDACLSALRQMHNRGVAHRDAHGENCLLRDDGSAALIDFELSAETSSRAYFDRDLWIMYHTVLD